MNKEQFLAAASHESGLTPKQMEKALEAILGTIVETVESGREVRLRNFGTFKAADRPAREARNPQTGDPVQVPAKRVPKAYLTFKLS